MSWSVFNNEQKDWHPILYLENFDELPQWFGLAVRYAHCGLSAEQRKILHNRGYHKVILLTTDRQVVQADLGVDQLLKSLTHSKKDRNAFTANKYRRVGSTAYTCLEACSSTGDETFKIPDPAAYAFNDARARWTDTYAKEVFNEHVASPPKDMLGYYVGDLDDLGDDGAAKRLHGYFIGSGYDNSDPQTRISGFTTLFLYASFAAGSGTSQHREDHDRPSFNHHRGGQPKLWVAVSPEPKNTQRFETLCDKIIEEMKEWHRLQAVDLELHDPAAAMKHKDMARNLQRLTKRKCTQYIRHYGILISTMEFDKAHVKYSVIPQLAGEIMVTLEMTYHQVVNAGPNVADATNGGIDFLFPDCEKAASSYRECGRGCGTKNPITKADMKALKLHQLSPIDIFDPDSNFKRWLFKRDDSFIPVGPAPVRAAEQTGINPGLALRLPLSRGEITLSEPAQAANNASLQGDRRTVREAMSLTELRKSPGVLGLDGEWDVRK